MRERRKSEGVDLQLSHEGRECLGSLRHGMREIDLCDPSRRRHVVNEMIACLVRQGSANGWSFGLQPGLGIGLQTEEMP